MRTANQIAADYREFRGQCKPLCEAAMVQDPTLTLVRGHYYCPDWGKQTHWWTVRPDGTIHDPSARQFPSNGIGMYVEFDGRVECSECGKEMDELEALVESNYAFCSGACHCRFVGVT